MTAHGVEVVTGQIERWFRVYEESWNSGEVGAVLSMYHRSLTGILGGVERDFADYTSTVAAMLRRPDRAELRLELKSARKLGAGHAIATGFVTSIQPQQRTVAPFTVILVHRGRGWKAVYSHS